MPEKYERESKRRPASDGVNASSFPNLDCDSKYSASGLELQGELQEKFEPKKRRSEAVAGLYQAAGERFSRWGAPAHPVEEYCKLVGESRCVEDVYHLMALWPPERLLGEVSALCADWYARRSGNVRECGTLLEFHVGEERAALHHANFCKDRLCPLCNWRRSLKIFGQVSKVMDALDGEGYRYLFLTLTVRNVWGDELSAAVQALYDGWRVLYHDYIRVAASARTSEKRLKGVVKGTFRALEVTVSDGLKSSGWAGSFHPHLHVILAVSPDYFKRGHYLTESEWADIWRKACDLDYKPQVKIEAVRPKPLDSCAFPSVSEGKAAPEEAGRTVSYAGAVAELSKYPMKDGDYNCDAQYNKDKGQYLSWVVHALRGRRLVGMTGRFKEVFHALELDDMEDGDLIHVGPDELRVDLDYLVVKCHWRCGAYDKFIYKPKADEGSETGVTLEEQWHSGDALALACAEAFHADDWRKRRARAKNRHWQKLFREGRLEELEKELQADANADDGGGVEK